MDKLFRTKNKLWQAIQSNLLFIGIVELLIYNDGGNALYEKTYGYEGALTTTVLMVVVIALLIYRLHKKGQLKSTMSILPADEPIAALPDES